MLEIKNLHASVDGSPILKGVDLKVNVGEVHAIMGPNGSGKSTLAQVLAGRDTYEVTDGSIRYKDKNLLDLEPEERACEGVFLAFQYPVEIPGVGVNYFLKAAYNAIRTYRGEDAIDAIDFLAIAKEKMEIVGLGDALAGRAVNAGFSGGEKKRTEIYQMLVLNPTLAILDETDSGLDIDALRIVASGVNAFQGADNATVIVTHYQRILEYIKPDHVHVLIDGRIVRSGDRQLALELEERGYDWLREEATV